MNLDVVLYPSEKSLPVYKLDSIGSLHSLVHYFRVCAIITREGGGGCKNQRGRHHVKS